jgi:cytochrome P450 / NADPH-cytochrome P450 reductase
MEESHTARFAPLLEVRTTGSDRLLQPGPVYTIGRDRGCDIVLADARVSRRHALLRFDNGHWVLADNDSANGTYVGERRVDRVKISGECLVRLGHPVQGVLVSCSLSEPAAAAPDGDAAPVTNPTARYRVRSASGQGEEDAHGPAERSEPTARGEADDGLREIPYAVRWLVPKGERFANFDILNDNDTQIDYFRRFGHVYAVGVPTKKWRLVVVSDPDLLDEVSADEERFGKRVEEINFFDQLANSRGGGISVIGDGPHYEQIRRVMLPWYSTQNQRTQFPRMKEQARKLVDAWMAISDSQPLDARAWIERYTLEVSGRGACNYDFGLFDGGDPHEFAVAVPESTKESIRRVADPFPDFTLFAGRARRARLKTYRRHNRELFRTAEALVRGRENTSPLGQQTDLLTRLLNTPDPETGEYLDTETVRDQVLMHLSNGFNGPAITGGWLAYVLATHPDVEAKLIAEIDGITGGDPDYDLQYDDLFALTYTTQVIKETLRIYPPLPVTIRRSKKDGALGGYRIRKDDIILVGTLAAQRDQRYWGPDPDRFDPEQFAIEKVVDRPRHAFIPFSIGKRQCMAQEVTFMMLRVVLFEIYRHYLLRIAPGATVKKNAVVTTKPASVPVVRLPREQARRPPQPAALVGRPGAAPVGGAPASAHAAAQSPAAARVRGPAREWGQPTDIPETSAYRELVIAYGSNFGANKELAELFADRSHFHGYVGEVITLNELAKSPPRVRPWLLIVMTSTYTSNPPSNATVFKDWLERTEPGSQTWSQCKYLVWGLGNTQWNAFLAFPRYVYKKLSDLGAEPLADFAYGDVGSPVWERRHREWNDQVWPLLLALSGARPTQAAAARDAAESAASGALTGADSSTAMQRSLSAEQVVPAASGPTSTSSIMRLMSSGSRLLAISGRGKTAEPAGHAGTAPRVFVAPTILTNGVGMATAEARVLACRELQSADSPKRTRHVEISLPPGVRYQAGDHIGVCPRNDEDSVERLALHLGAALDSLFMVPKTMNVRTVPKGVVLQVRNVLTSLVDISGRPTVTLLALLLEKAADPDEWSRLAQIKDVLAAPEGPASPLRAVIDAGGYDTLRLLDDFPSCRLNIFELLQVAQPLRPRYYSASSSPRVHGADVAHLTVGLAPEPVPGMPDREFRGAAARYVHALRVGDRLNIFHNSADGFRLQDDVTKPMIFVSAGTGIAPMRAFLWERLAMLSAGAALGESALFNGIRSRQVDGVYHDEIERFIAAGALDHLHVAASREIPGRRDHVQDLIRQQGALVWRLLAAGGYVYVCGSQPMRAAVRAALTDVVTASGALPRERAEAYLDEMETTGRYRPDLWG